MPPATDAVLRTERLLLRPLRDDDLAPFAALNADPRVMVHFPAPLTRAESDAVVTRIGEHYALHGFGPWAVEVPGVTPFAGLVGLLKMTLQGGLPPRSDRPPFTPCVEVAWRLAAAWWGRGYATEAAKASLAFGFETLDLHEILSWTVPANVASWRVMERLGMTHSPADDFDHPRVPAGHPLCRHVLYRLRREAWAP